MQTERSRNHPPTPQALPPEHRLSPRAPGCWGRAPAPGAVGSGSGQGRQGGGQGVGQGHAAALLSPRGHGPCMRGPGRGRGGVPGGCGKVGGRPALACPIPPPRAITAWKLPPAGGGGWLPRREPSEAKALCGRLSAASGGAFRPLWYAERRLLSAAAAGREGARRAGKRERGGGEKKSAEVPTATLHRPRAGQSGSRHPGWRGGEGCGLPGLLLVDVGVSKRQREPMIYYTAVPASGASRSGAATAGQPAHTHSSAHTQHPSPRSPGSGSSRLPRRASACRQPAGRGERAGRRGWGGDTTTGPEPGARGARRAGISPEKLPAPPPAEHPFSRTLLAQAAGLAARTPRARGDATAAARPPPGPGGPGARGFASLM